MHKEKNEILEDYDEKGFIYETWSILLKCYFFQETHQIESGVQFKDYQPDVICFQYSHLVCAASIKWIEVKSNKKLKA